MFNAKFDASANAIMYIDRIKGMIHKLYIDGGIGRNALEMLHHVNIRMWTDDRPYSKYSIETNVITLSQNATSAEVFHELLHALQRQNWAQNNPGIDIYKALISLEIEAWVGCGFYAFHYNSWFSNGGFEISKHATDIGRNLNGQGMLDYRDAKKVIQGKATPDGLFEQDIKDLENMFRNDREYSKYSDEQRPAPQNRFKTFYDIINYKK